MRIFKNTLIRGILLFLLGIAIGYILPLVSTKSERVVEEERELHLPSSSSSSSIALTNPLLECDLGPDYISKNSIKPFRQEIQTKVDDAVLRGRVTHVSYYFRDLNNGSWFGINEKETFSPASLLKVPLMIYVLKRAETDPSFLSQEIEYTGGDSTADQITKPESPIEAGKVYTVRELVERMIVDSDNIASSVLAQYVGRENFESVFIDLGLATIENNGSNLMSVKNYAAFFRVLFNASYISHSLSEGALSLLTQTKFNDGIRASIPKDIVIAHKFGEREYEDQKQLHDCGVVYQNKHPYLLCIMTRGDDWNELKQIIQDLAKVTYEEVRKQQ